MTLAFRPRRERFFNGISLVRLTTGAVFFNGLDWTLSPAHPGDTLVFWGTGGGADSANDTGGTSGDQTTAGNFAVTVAGRQIRPLYVGASSGYPGLWQINFTLPADIATGCFNTAQVTAGGEASNTVLVPIAAAGQSSGTAASLSESTLARLYAGGTITLGHRRRTLHEHGPSLIRFHRRNRRRRHWPLHACPVRRNERCATRGRLHRCLYHWTQYRCRRPR